MEQSFNLKDVTVHIAMPINRDMPVDTVKSLIATQALCMSKGVPLDIYFQIGCSIIEAARSKSANSFLKGPCTHIFWVDSDMGWEPEDFLRLVCLATKMDIVGASYPQKKDPITFPLAGTDGEIWVANEYGCIPVKGYGLGFTCMKRHVIETLAARSPILKFPDIPEPIPHIFRCDVEGNEFRGEDMAFLSDCKQNGFQPYLDPTIHLRHIGTKSYAGRLADVLQKEPG